ncbi:hypothetical protein [Sphaerisporangium dianthi]|uniref:Uncharacterized protein n=1 Tax=Sphaerisporangium dianthi TaxID=1436120 RepID=A0ABV9CTJ3_9ACTN
MKPIPGAGGLGETVDQRVAERIEAARRRRLAAKALRAAFAQRRAYGLRARHAARERNTPPPADGKGEG